MATPSSGKLADNLDLFPLFGYARNLRPADLAAPSTVMLAGDAVPTQDVSWLGGVPESWDISKARESLRGCKVADLIIQADNMFVNPRWVDVAWTLVPFIHARLHHARD